MINNYKKIGLVLGSGGARALAQIGVLKVMEQENILPDIIVGSSMGAFIGGIYATGVSIDKMEKVACQTSIKLTAQMLTPGLPISGIVNFNRVRNFLKDLGADVNIEDLNVQFAAVATDFTTGEEIILNRGSLIEAIISSAAFPVLFKPVYYQNKFMVDGGLINPLPINIAHKMGADYVSAVNVVHSPEISYKRKNRKLKRKSIIKENLSQLHNVMFTHINKLSKSKQTVTSLEDCSRFKVLEEDGPVLPGIVNNMLQGAYILENRIIQLQLQLEKPDILISPDISDFKMLEFHRAKELIAIGEKTAQKALPQIKKLVKTSLEKNYAV